MDETFISDVQSDNLDCWISKVENAVASKQAGLAVNPNYYCDTQFHSIVDKALSHADWLAECDLERIVNVYYRITGT